jgi:hypothetical protein
MDIKKTSRKKMGPAKHRCEKKRASETSLALEDKASASATGPAS